MNVIALDTLAIARDLEAAGVERRQAEAHAQALRKATAASWEYLATKADLAVLATKAEISTLATKAELANLATKGDIANLATKDEIANLATKDEIANLATKAEVSKLRGEVAALEIRFTQRLYTVVISAFIANSLVSGALLKLL